MSDSGAPGVGAARRRMLGTLRAPLASIIVYFAVRPAVGSDAAALAIAGIIPTGYAIAVALVRRRVDPWAVATAASFAGGCIISLLAGGSSLPLKLHEVAVTFALGVVLLVSVLVGRPVAVGRMLRAPRTGGAPDATLTVMVGSFLVLHALLHIALALILSTNAYLTAGRVINWATLGIGGFCLYSYTGRLRRRAAKPRPAPDQIGRVPRQ